MKRILRAKGLAFAYCIPFAIILALFTSHPASAQSVVDIFTTENSLHCNNGSQYGALLNFSGLDAKYFLTNAEFVEYDNGTAILTGILTNQTDNTIQFKLNTLFKDYNSNPPAGSPVANECYNPNPSQWFFYETIEGTFTGIGSTDGAALTIARRGPSFQVGDGANVIHNEAFGASGGFEIAVQQQPTSGPELVGKTGNFNFLLNPKHEKPCDLTTSSIQGFSYIGEFNNSKYFHSDIGDVSWTEAKEIAQNSGGYLVVINDKEENKFVKQALKKGDGWIGLSDEMTEGTFEWVNGDPLNYTNWKNGEPNNSGGDQDFARIIKNSGTWGDREASYRTEFIMEVPCDPNTPKKVTIGDMVWDDLNANGIMDDGEPGIEDVKVQLIGTTLDGVFINQILYTDMDGKYKFTDLDPGDYKVIFSELPGGYFATVKNQGPNDFIDSDVDPVDGSTEPKSYPNGAEDLSIDAGYYRKAEIGDFVWHDLNGDGLRDLNEPGISDISVELNGTDGLGNVVNKTTSTNGVGIYFFNGLLPGDYKLTFVPSGDYIPTLKDQGADDSIDSDLDPTTLMTDFENLISGESNQTYDAGLIIPVKICGIVFIDHNNDGLQNAGDDYPGKVVVDLLKLNPATGDYEYVDSRTTDSDGQFAFTDLKPGTYKLDVDETTLPAGFLFTPLMDVNGNANDDIDSDVNSEGEISNIIILSGKDDCSFGVGLVDQKILPVELVRFTGEVINNNEVLLKWVTASEENNQHFVIERSKDGNRFEVIGTVEGNGTTTATSNYQFLDEAPHFGRNYYRLKQVDFNGRFEFSEIVTVTIKGNDLPDAIVYPNPAETQTIMRMVKPLQEDATLEVVSAIGQVMYQIVLPAGTNSHRIDMSDYHAGFYYLHLSYDGQRRLAQRVLKIQE